MIFAYKYGLLNPTSGFDQSAVDVLYKRNKLWNRFVEIERANRVEYREIVTASSPALTAIQDQINAIDAQFTELSEAKKKARQQARNKKDADTAGFDAQMNVLKDQLKELRIKAKELRVGAKENAAPALEALETRRRTAVRESLQQDGLWWGNNETVLDAYNVARVKAMKENAELNFHRFDGGGKFAVRDKDGMTWETLTAGKHSVAKIIKLPDSETMYSKAGVLLSERAQRSRAQYILTMRIYTYKNELGKLTSHDVVWPIVIHRGIPDGAAIKTIAVHRKRVGNEFTWSCSITIDDGKEKTMLIDHASSSVCGIDLGFRKMGDGRLRVAMLADAHGTRELSLPRVWVSGMAHVEAIQARMDDAANVVWAHIQKDVANYVLATKSKELVDGAPEFKQAPLDAAVEALRRAAGKLTSKNAAPTQRMLKLIAIIDSKELTHDERQLASLSKPADALRLWAAARRRPFNEMNNLREKLQGQRTHIYREFAARVAKNYVDVHIEKMDLKELSQTKKNREVEDNPLHQAARHQRKNASLYSLVLSIKQACVKSGSDFAQDDAAYSTTTCSSCGASMDASTDIVVSCKACGAHHDQDENAAKNFLKGFKTPE
jgi:hypothetical protein